MFRPNKSPSRNRSRSTWKKLKIAVAKWPKWAAKRAPSGVDKLVLEVLDRYDEFRAISFDPSLPLTVDPVALPGSRSVFIRYVSEAMRLISGNEGERSFGATFAEIAQLSDANGGNPISKKAGETIAAMEKVRGLVAPLFVKDATKISLSLEEASTAVEKLYSAVSSLEEFLRTQKESLYEQLKRPGAKGNDTLAKVVRELATNARELLRLSQEMRVALYDEGKGILIAPSLNVTALSAKRDTTNTSQPWLSLHAVLLSDGLTEQFPPAKLKKVRSNWTAFARSAQLALQGKPAPDFEETQADFVQSVRALGEAIEPIREELIAKTLKDDELDSDLVLYTRYPNAEVTARELHYNTLSPFFWSWCISLCACVSFSLAMGPFRTLMFWLGASIFFGGILFTGYGFYLRVAITGWAPVTNMYETVIFVPYVVAILGLWFLLLPMLWPGISHAWRLNALPFTWEANDLTREQTGQTLPRTWTIAGAVLAIPRLLGMAFLFWFLALATATAMATRRFSVLCPRRICSRDTSPMASMIYWSGRSACSASLFRSGMVPELSSRSWARSFSSLGAGQRTILTEMLSDTQSAHWFGWAAAAFAAFGTCVAWYSPPDILNKNFSPLQPVLRSNFWLTIHVLTIVASYGAGFFALILGNISIGYLIFGKYRVPAPSGLAAKPGMGAAGGVIRGF